jgi:hypothetical protein
MNIIRSIRVILAILRNPERLEAFISSPGISSAEKLEFHAREFMALIPSDGMDHEARIEMAFRFARRWMKEISA